MSDSTTESHIIKNIRPGPIVQEDVFLVYLFTILCYHGIARRALEYGRMKVHFRAYLVVEIWRMKSISVVSRGRHSVVGHEDASAFSC